MKSEKTIGKTGKRRYSIVKKTQMSNLTTGDERKARAIIAIKGSKKKKFKDGEYPSSNKAKKLKEWKDGWFK